VSPHDESIDPAPGSPFPPLPPEKPSKLMFLAGFLAGFGIGFIAVCVLIGGALQFGNAGTWVLTVFLVMAVIFLWRQSRKRSGLMQGMIVGVSTMFLLCAACFGLIGLFAR
jgi:hypothetical protein